MNVFGFSPHIFCLQFLLYKGICYTCLLGEAELITPWDRDWLKFTIMGWPCQIKMHFNEISANKIFHWRQCLKVFREKHLYHQAGYFSYPISTAFSKCGAMKEVKNKYFAVKNYKPIICVKGLNMSVFDFICLIKYDR